MFAVAGHNVVVAEAGDCPPNPNLDNSRLARSDAGNQSREGKAGISTPITRSRAGLEWGRQADRRQAGCVRSSIELRLEWGPAGECKTAHVKDGSVQAGFRDMVVEEDR